MFKVWVFKDRFSSANELNDYSFCEKIELMQEKLEKPRSIKILQWIYWIVVIVIILTIAVWVFFAYDAFTNECYGILPGFPGRLVLPEDSPVIFCDIDFDPKARFLKISSVFVLLFFIELSVIQLLRKCLKK